MVDWKIHIPVRKKKHVTGQQTVRMEPDAYNKLVDVHNESGMPIKEIVSLMVMQSVDKIVLDKEE